MVTDFPKPDICGGITMEKWEAEILCRVYNGF